MWIVLFSVPRDGNQGLKTLFSVREGRKIRSCVRYFPSLGTESYLNLCYFPSVGTEIEVWKTLFSVLGGRNRTCMRCFLSQGRKVEVSCISAFLVVRQLPILSAYGNRYPGPKMLLSRLNGAVSTNLWHRNVVTCGKSPVSELQCQFQGMSSVVYAPQMKVG